VLTLGRHGVGAGPDSHFGRLILPSGLCMFIRYSGNRFSEFMRSNLKQWLLEPRFQSASPPFLLGNPGTPYLFRFRIEYGVPR